MPTFAIGDIHGCSATLWRLLDRIEYRPGRDRLWLVGDLVNRGPKGLEVLRWTRAQGDAVVVVLGNHDLHLLARAEGVRHTRPRDTFEDVLDAPDRDELLTWLRERPLVHREGRFTLVHAGVLPGWSLAELVERGEELSSALRGDRWRRALKAIYDQPPRRRWTEVLSTKERLQFQASALTRLRMCDRRGRPIYSYSGPPELAPNGLRPWFDWRPPDASGDQVVIFGHWAALGRHIMPFAWSLDSGCAWGGALSAVCLDDGRVFEEPCADEQPRIRG